MKRLVALGICAFMGCAYAQNEDPIGVRSLRPSGPGMTGNSALSGICDGGDQQPEITCRFTELKVSLVLEPEDLAEETENQLRELRKNLKDRGLKGHCEWCCADLNTPAKRAQLLKEARKKGPLHRAADIAWSKACEVPTRQNFEDWTRKYVAARTTECTVTTFLYPPIKFQRISPDKWTASLPPISGCKATYLYQLERFEGTKHLWRYSLTHPGADLSDPKCKHIDDDPDVAYSWDGRDPNLACEAVSFGR